MSGYYGKKLKKDYITFVTSCSATDFTSAIFYQKSCKRYFHQTKRVQNELNRTVGEGILSSLHNYCPSFCLFTIISGSIYYIWNRNGRRQGPINTALTEEAIVSEESLTTALEETQDLIENAPELEELSYTADIVSAAPASPLSLLNIRSFITEQKTLFFSDFSLILQEAANCLNELLSLYVSIDKLSSKILRFFHLFLEKKVKAEEIADYFSSSKEIIQLKQFNYQANNHWMWLNTIFHQLHEISNNFIPGLIAHPESFKKFFTLFQNQSQNNYHISSIFLDNFYSVFSIYSQYQLNLIKQQMNLFNLFYSTCHNNSQFQTQYFYILQTVFEEDDPFILNTISMSNNPKYFAENALPTAFTEHNLSLYHTFLSRLNAGHKILQNLIPNPLLNNNNNSTLIANHFDLLNIFHNSINVIISSFNSPNTIPILIITGTMGIIFHLANLKR
jgi:hypothetical protein